MNRELPIYTIEGTDFEVDVANLQLREKANPDNKISLFEMKDLGNGYVFDYDPATKNLHYSFQDHENVTEVKIPELVQLDPVGMAEKYGLPVEAVEGKKDFDVMVKPLNLHKRIKMGQLPRIKIAGHIFYADARIDLLRPKDDFSTMGIKFSEIEDFLTGDHSSYIIPYNPKTHCFQEPDYANLVQYPEDLIVIEFPHQRVLDPVGWNRYLGFEETWNLKQTGLELYFEAKIVDWKDTQIDQIIQQNLKRLNQQEQDKQKGQKQKNSKRPHRGRKM